MTEKMNIGILSPSRDAYSETFIHAHKSLLKGRVFYYYGSLKDKKLEGAEPLFDESLKLFYKVKRKFLGKPYSWFYERFLIKSLKRNKIDVLLIEYGTTAYQHLSVLEETKIPAVVHFHGYDASVKEVISHCDNYKAVFELAKFVVVVSKKMKTDLLKLGCPEEKLMYNTYGPMEEFFEAKPSYQNPHFFSVGRFVEKKAPYYLILSFKRVYDKYPKAKLLMAGDGPLLEVCQNLVRYLKMNKAVTFLGVINSQDIIKNMERSIAYVQHSITASSGDAEGTPLAVLEASAAGLPVLSTNHAGIPDVVIDGISGYLVEEHDVDGMAINMIKLLAEPALAKKLGTEGKKNIRENFDLNLHIQTLNKILVDSKKASR